MLVRRVNVARLYVRQRGFEPAALALIKRMTRAQRLKLARNKGGYWAFAFSMLVARQAGLIAPLVDPFEDVTPEAMRAIRARMKALRPKR